MRLPCTSIQEAPAVYTDDTGWKVGGENAHLMVFDTYWATVYQMRARHRHQEEQEVVPVDYQGVMIADRGRSYEDNSFRRVKQSRLKSGCLAHIQKALSTLVEKKKGGAGNLGPDSIGVKMLFRVAIDLREEHQAGAMADLRARAGEVWFALSYLLRPRTLKDPDNQHLLKLRGRYHRRGELLRFLEDPSIEPTNNRVERALRPAVITRPDCVGVSQCSKTRPGADAFAAFKSVIQSLVKRGGGSVVEPLAILFRSPKGQPDPG
jgi:transposase